MVHCTCLSQALFVSLRRDRYNRPCRRATTNDGPRVGLAPMTCTRRVVLQTIGVGTVGCMMGCNGDTEGSVPAGKATMCGPNLCVSLTENPDLAGVGGIYLFSQATGKKIFLMRV